MPGFQRTFRARSPLPDQGSQNGSPHKILDRGRSSGCDYSNKSSSNKKSRERDSSRRSRSPDRRSRSPVRKAQTFPQQSNRAAKATAKDTEAIRGSTGGANTLPTPAEQLEAIHPALHSPTQPSSQGCLATIDAALDDSSSLENVFDQFAKAFADASHWWSEAYKASKRTRSLMQSTPKVGSEYESHHAVHQAQITEQKTIMNYANERFANARRNTQATFTTLLRRPEFTAITSNGFDPAKQDALEDRIAWLENTYKNAINDKDQRIAQLETKVSISSKRQEDQRIKISTINEEILELRDLLEGAQTEIQQLKADFAARKVEHEISQSATDAKISGIEAQLNNHIKSVASRSQCLEEKMDEVISNSWPRTNEKPLSRADLEPFAKKAHISKLVSKADVAQLVSGLVSQEDIAQLVSQKDVAQVVSGLVSQEDIAQLVSQKDVAQLISGLVSKEDIAQLASHKDIKGLVKRDELHRYATSQGLQALKSTVGDMNMTCATKQQIRGLASKEDVRKIIAMESFKSVAKAWEHGSSAMEQHTNGRFDGLGLVAARLQDAEASLEGLLRFQGVYAEHRLSSRVHELEETVMKRAELESIGLDQLKDLSSRDFSTEIADQVRIQVTRQAPAQPTPAPSPVSSISSFESEIIVVEVKNRIQKDLDSLKHLVNPLIDYERTRSEELREEVINALAAFRGLETRVNMLESIPPTPTTAELQDVLSESIRLINDVNQSTTRSNESIRELINGLQSELRGTAQTLSRRQDSLKGLVDENFNQLALQHEHLHLWQQNFSTSDIYARIVAKMQEMVPTGTAARVRCVEDRLEFMENDLLRRTQHPNRQVYGAV